MVQAYPNYEFRYLKHLLGRQKELFQLTTVLQDAEPEYVEQDQTAIRVFPQRSEELLKFDVIVFGDVNPAFLSRSIMENISDFVKKQGRGIVFIAGPKYTPLAYRNTPLAELMPVILSSVTLPNPEAVLTQSFQPQPTALGLASPPTQLGDSPQQTTNVWQSLPGLYWLLEASEVKSGTRVLATHPVRRASSGERLPLICMQYVGGGKVMFVV